MEDMLKHLGGWIIAGLGLVWANRERIAKVAAEAVAYAEKYYADGHLSDVELEEIAVDVARKKLPLVPTILVRTAIRAICKARKRLAVSAGLYGPGEAA